jgi:hypothetical protein
MVILSYGFVPSAASIGQSAQPGFADSRALSVAQVYSDIVSVLSAAWVNRANNRVVFLIPSLPYSPAPNAFLPAAQGSCSDPLAGALYNSPASALVSESLARLQTFLQAQFALATLAPSIGGLAAQPQIVTLDTLLAPFTFTQTASSLNQAWDSSCVNMTSAGQNLLARYLYSCLRGLTWTNPTSLQSL